MKSNALSLSRSIGCVGIVVALMGCLKKELSDTPILDVLTITQPTAVLADSASTTTLSVHLGHYWAIDQRSVTFRVASGALLNTSTGSVQGNEYTVTADAEGAAHVLWRSGRQPGPVQYSVLTQDAAYNLDGTISTEPAWPERIVLSTPSIEYSSADSIATINASLVRDIGYHSRGLPLEFKAFRRVGGVAQPTGNFLTGPFLLTGPAIVHSIQLDLSVPGIAVFPDTVFVTAQSGPYVSEDTLHLFFFP